MVEKTDEENIDMSIGARYMPSRQYAISFRVDRDLYETNSNRDFIPVDQAEENLGYALTFNAYL